VDLEAAFAYHGSSVKDSCDCGSARCGVDAYDACDLQLAMLREEGARVAVR